MTVEEYKEEFTKLYEQLIEEHGPVNQILLSDDTKNHINQMPINSTSKWISCTIIFA